MYQISYKYRTGVFFDRRKIHGMSRNDIVTTKQDVNVSTDEVKGIIIMFTTPAQTL